MTPTEFEKPLEEWKKFAHIMFGAGSAFLLTAIGNGIGDSIYGWAFTWIILQILTLFPVFVLIIGSIHRRIPFVARLDLIFVYLSAAWLVFFGFLSHFSINYGLSFLDFLIIMGGSGVALSGLYLALKKRLDRKEDIFP